MLIVPVQAIGREIYANDRHIDFLGTVERSGDPEGFICAFFKPKIVVDNMRQAAEVCRGLSRTIQRDC